MKLSYLSVIIALFLASCGGEKEVSNRSEETPEENEHQNLETLTEPPEEGVKPISSSERKESVNEQTSANVVPAKLYYDPKFKDYSTGLVSFDEYDEKRSKLNSVWQARATSIVDQLNSKMESYESLSRAKTKVYNEVRMKFSYSDQNTKKNTLIEVAKNQAQALMLLTNKAFDEEQQDKDNSETLNKLKELDSKFSNVKEKLVDFSKYYNRLRDAELKKYSSSSKSFKGLDKSLDELNELIRKTHEDHLKKKLDLANKYPSLIKLRPLEIDLLYKVPNEEVFVFGILNVSDTAESIPSLFIFLEQASGSFAFQINGMALSDPRTRKPLTIQPREMKLISLRRSGPSYFIDKFSRSSILPGETPLENIYSLRKLYSVAKGYNIKYYYGTESMGSYNPFSIAAMRQKIQNDTAYQQAKRSELALLNEMVGKAIEGKDDSAVERHKKQLTEHSKLRAEAELNVKKTRDKFAQDSKEIAEQERSLRSSRDSKSRAQLKELSLKKRNLYLKYREDYQSAMREVSMIRGRIGYSSIISPSTIAKLKLDMKGPIEEMREKRRQIDRRFAAKGTESIQLDCILIGPNYKYFRMRNISNQPIRSCAFRIEHTSINGTYLWDGKTSMAEPGDWGAGEVRYFKIYSHSTTLQRTTPSSMTIKKPLATISENEALSKQKGSIIFDNNEDAYDIFVYSVQKP